VTIRRVFSLIVAVLLTIAAPAFGSTPTYTNALHTVANHLERAAKTGAAVPDVHVPPAPLGGPPRYSPSIDDWLQSVLSDAKREHKPKDRTASLRSIAAALRYLAETTGSSAVQTQPRADVAATAAKILADPAYRQAATKPAQPHKESYFEKILRLFFERLGQLLDRLATATQGVPLLGTVFAFVLIGIALAGLAYVGFRIADGFVVRRRAVTFEGGELLPAALGVEGLHAAALDAARSRQFARAVALLFQASLVLLDRTNRVAYDPARTAGEYRRLVRRKAQPIAGEFDVLARIFTAAAYAQTPLGEVDWAQAASAFDGLGRPLAAQ
jgi:hypothetical protein